MAARIRSLEGRWGKPERISARRPATPQSSGPMSSKFMDCLAVSLQPGSANCESNATSVREIVTQSGNCAIDKGLDFNAQESNKLRYSDTRRRQRRRAGVKGPVRGTYSAGLERRYSADRRAPIYSTTRDRNANSTSRNSCNPSDYLPFARPRRLPRAREPQRDRRDTRRRPEDGHQIWHRGSVHRIVIPRSIDARKVGCCRSRSPARERGGRSLAVPAIPGSRGSQEGGSRPCAVDGGAVVTGRSIYA